MKIGVDLGGTQLRAGLVAKSGKIICLKVLPTHAADGAQVVTERLIAVIQSLPDWQQANFIGVGVPCATSKDGNMLQLASNLPGFDGFPLRDRLEKSLGRSVLLENDANAACLGEALLGAGRGYESMAYITLSTGIGGGIYENGRLLRGTQGAACEFGSITMDSSRPAFGGLPRGAVESEISGTALVRRAGASYNHAGEVFADPRCAALTEDFVHGMAVLLSNVACMYDPACFVLGGGCMKSQRYFWDALCKAYVDFAQETYRNIPLLPALLEEPGLVGAALLQSSVK